MHEATEPDSQGKRYLVIIIENLLSPEFEKNMWEKRINDQAFTKGKAGRSKSMVRMFSDGPVPVHMVIGKTNAYETLIGDDLSQLDKDLLAAARYLCQLQRQFLEGRLEEEMFPE